MKGSLSDVPCVIVCSLHAVNRHFFFSISSPLALLLYQNRPINLIQSTPERWIYVLIFGSLSGDLLLSIVSNGYGFTQSANATIYGGCEYFNLVAG